MRSAPHAPPAFRTTPLSARGKQLASSAAAVLAAHALLLLAWQAPPPGRPAAPNAGAPPVTLVHHAAAPVPVRAEAAAAAVAAAAASPRASRTAQPRQMLAPSPATRAQPATPSAHRQEADSAASPPAALATTPSPATAAAAAEQAAPAVPTYATVLPASGQWQYEWRRGASVTLLTLRWALRDGGRYELSLQGPEGARNAPLWRSRGGLDSAGIAPERFTAGQGGHERRAANFQREQGEISFSGPSARVELAAGTQDRLSWMLQLPAVLQARPEFGRLGTRISMWVVGAHGDAAVWSFDSAGPQPADPAAGVPAGALLLQRESTRAFDPSVQVWLDPSRGHWPVRIQMRVPGTSQSTELRLAALQPSDPTADPP